MTKYYRISDPSDVRDLGEQMAAWELADNPKRLNWAVQPAAPSADAVWTDGVWIVPPAATDLATANATIATLQARIESLTQELPYNPRILKGQAFYNRVSKEDIVTLLTSEDPQLVLVGKTIDAYRDNKWPVILDSTDFQQLVGYVLASRVFDQAEVDAVMKDASREEAYTV